MNNRLTIQDLACLLADQTGKDKNTAEHFLREFIAVVSEGVYADKLVKIKGLGTFKIIPVEKRESIHVNTGERFLIPAHYKFSFLPDKELRELVNKPFSFFETTELGDETDFSDLDVSDVVDDKETDDESVEEMMPEEQLLPAVPLTDQSVTATGFQSPVPAESVVHDAVSESAAPEIVTSVSVMSEPETSDFEAPESVTPESILTDPELQGTEHQRIEEAGSVRPHFRRVGERRRNLRKRTTVQIVIIVLLLGVANTVIFLNRGIFLNESRSRQTVPNDVVLPVSSDTLKVFTDVATIGDTIALDSIAGPDSALQPKPEANSEVKSDTKPGPDNGVTSPDVIARVKIEAGSRLTLIALEYYGSKHFWVYLYEHNKSKIKDPNNVPIGTVVEIPAPRLYGIDAHDRASVEKATMLQTQILSGK